MFEQKLPLKNLTKQEKLNTDKFDLTLINEGLFDVTFVKAPLSLASFLFRLAKWITPRLNKSSGGDRCQTS